MGFHIETSEKCVNFIIHTKFDRHCRANLIQTKFSQRRRENWINQNGKNSFGTVIIEKDGSFSYNDEN